MYESAGLSALLAWSWPIHGCVPEVKPEQINDHQDILV